MDSERGRVTIVLRNHETPYITTGHIEPGHPLRFFCAHPPYLPNPYPSRSRYDFGVGLFFLSLLACHPPEICPTCDGLYEPLTAETLTLVELR